MVAEKIVESLSHLRQLEEFAKGNSFIHKRDGRIKVMITLIYVLVIAGVPVDAQGHLIRLAMYPMALWALSQLPIKPFWNRVLLMLPFILCVGIGTLFTDGTPISIDGFQVPRGVLLAINLCIKSVLSILGVLYLLGTTPLSDVIEALRALRVPNIVVSQLNFVIRYLTLLMEETANMVRAYVLRSGHALDGISYKQWGGVLGNLFLRTYDRAIRVQQAMLLRQNNTGERKPERVHSNRRMTTMDFIYFFAWILFFLLSFLGH